MANFRVSTKNGMVWELTEQALIMESLNWGNIQSVTRLPDPETEKAKPSWVDVTDDRLGKLEKELKGTQENVTTLCARGMIDTLRKDTDERCVSKNVSILRERVEDFSRRLIEVQRRVLDIELIRAGFDNRMTRLERQIVSGVTEEETTKRLNALVLWAEEMAAKVEKLETATGRGQTEILRRLSCMDDAHDRLQAHVTIALSNHENKYHATFSTTHIVSTGTVQGSGSSPVKAMTDAHGTHYKICKGE